MKAQKNDEMSFFIIIHIALKVILLGKFKKQCVWCTIQIRVYGTHLMISLRCPVFAIVKMDDTYHLSNFMPKTEAYILMYKYRISEYFVFFARNVSTCCSWNSMVRCLWLILNSWLRCKIIVNKTLLRAFFNQSQIWQVKQYFYRMVMNLLFFILCKCIMGVVHIVNCYKRIQNRNISPGYPCD